MPIEITMPRLSDTMQEGTLVKWRVKEGDSVKSGDLLADVETDKATMELQSFDDGVVAKVMVGEGDTAAVGALILLLAEEGEDAAEVAKSAGEGKASGGDEESDKDEQPTKEKQPAKVVVKKKTKDADEVDEEGGDEADDAAGDEGSDEAGDDEADEESGAKVRISPLARKIAEDKGVDVGKLKGSGPSGRIIKRDVLAAAEGKSPTKPAGGKQSPAADAKPAGKSQAGPAGGSGGSGGAVKPIAASSSAPAQAAPLGGKLEARTISVSNMRKTIARRLLESKTTIPHFQVTISVNMDPLLTLRETLNTQLESQGIKLSVNDFIVRGCALAILQHPLVNSSWSDAGIQQHGTVNIGVAVALPEEKGGGLVVPTLRDVQNKGLRAISNETRKLAKKAREGGLTIEEMAEGTFTISNLGMFGVEHFTAIINPPQSAILAVGAALEKAVVRDGQIVIGQEMSVTISADHRVVDGAAAAAFLNTLKQMLENPAGLLV